MDFEMETKYDQETQTNLWDFKVTNGSFHAIDHEVADQQRAIIAVFLQRGTIPQMPELGNQWAEFLTGEVMPAALNAQIKNSITDLTGQAKYMPKYSDEDGNLVVEVVKT